MYETIKNFGSQFAYQPTLVSGDGTGRYKKFVVLGMGGSNLMTGLLKIGKPELDVISHRDYGLPPLSSEDWDKTFVVAVSYSGNTEETIDGFRVAGERNLSRAAISIGGKLLEEAKKGNAPYIQLPDTKIQPRSAAGFIFLALLKIMGEEKLLEEVKELRLSLRPEDYEDAGRKLAEKLKGFVPIIYASLRNKPLAQNWKARFNETGKIPAFYNVFPELNHNEMTGFDPVRALTAFPGQPISDGISSFEERRKLNSLFHFIFLKDDQDHPRIQKRMEMTARLYQDRGLPVEVLKLDGKNHLLKIFSSLVLADWTSYYTAQEYGVEADQVPMVEEFKKLIA